MVHSNGCDFYCVCFSFGGKHVTPRTLTSQFLGNMVCVEGIVTKSRFTYLLNCLSFILLCHLATRMRQYCFCSSEQN